MYDININVVCHYLEKTANIGACIPVVGTYIIVGRFFAGATQTILGVSARIIAGIVESSIGRGYLKGWNQRKWQKICELGAEHTKHGLLNMGVAIDQLAIGYFTFNLGNLFIYFHKGNFDPYVPYKGIMAPNSYAQVPNIEIKLAREYGWR